MQRVLIGALLSGALLALSFISNSAQAQTTRVFVSGQGSDNSPCTLAKPCRTFQRAFNTAPANGVIDVLDPADYGPVTITHGISIQGHDFGAITQSASSGVAITISVTGSNFTSDPVTLNGLLLDGGGTGLNGIKITLSNSVQILNSVVRNFSVGINDIASTDNVRLLVEDTIVSDNTQDGIHLAPSGTNTRTTLSRSTASNNQTGVNVISGNTTIANSVISNNQIGLNINDGVNSLGGNTAYLAKNVITTNTQVGVNALQGAFTYGDNYINNNGGRNVIAPSGLTSYPTL
jgi:hypothetical protein